MKTDSNNLKFEYLHRDGGNYKIFGSIIIKNIDKISPSKATLLLEKKLIDAEYFYPEKAKIPLFEEHKGTVNFLPIGMNSTNFHSRMKIHPTVVL